MNIWTDFMITDMNGKEFKYLDYVIYLRNNNPALAKVIRIIIAKSTRMVVVSVFGSVGYERVENIALKNFNNIEIVTEVWAKENYTDDYERLKNCRK